MNFVLTLLGLLAVTIVAGVLATVAMIGVLDTAEKLWRWRSSRRGQQ